MNDHYDGVLLEDINHKVDMILESQAALATSMELGAVDERLIRVETNVEIIKRVVTEHSTSIKQQNNRLNSHNKRITTLEQQTA
jgi:hypothetical protein